MLYAIIGDLHSNETDTIAVLTQIKKIAPHAEIIGLGDLYECHIGKKKAQKNKLVPLQKAVTLTPSFERLLTFPSVIGNQEERIAHVTGDTRFLKLPQTLAIEHATIIHGHQFMWDEAWHPTFPTFTTPLVFFGHSHRAAIYHNGERITMPANTMLDVANAHYIINVGAVVFHREWCLYDSTKKTIHFMRA